MGKSKNPFSILVVDDEQEYLSLFREVISENGYRVVAAKDGLEALEILEKEREIFVILADYKMPLMRGTDFLNRAKAICPLAPRIMVTAYQSIDVMEESINKSEVFRFLTKPLNLDRLLESIRDGCDLYLKRKEEIESRKRKDELIEKLSTAIETGIGGAVQLAGDEEAAEEKKVTEKSEVMTVEMFEMLSSLSTALDIINPTLNAHHKRTCFLASSIASELGFPAREVSSIFIAAILHDIGAIALADRFKLLAFEDSSPHTHAELGAILFASFPPFAPLAPLVRYHHVPWKNGKGNTFNGGEVPRGSHVIHLADRVAVLVRSEGPIFDQVPEIEHKIGDAAGEVFVPQFVDAFLNLSRREAFWLDVTSASLDRVLKLKSHLPEIPLGLDGLEELTRFFSMIIDTRSHFTANHSSGVASSAAELARLMGLSSVECKKIRIAGYLHDLGKLAVSETILEKPARLDRKEMQIMKAHTYHTYNILREVEGLEEIAEWASFHHERLHGEGYPFHVTAEHLPLGSRVMAVADIFTALAEDRPYRKGMALNEIRGEFSNLLKQGGLDEEVVRVLIENLDQVDRIRTVSQQLQDKDLENFWNRSRELVRQIERET
ncbi:MAG: hypothetical protein COV67_08070 [Nitrospinae bacterium CG11_big_fil_rev_8_21_14_0_20_56_8]|nr:MAG: hypothetical protein COV67_08070 [Nitrospinae bacterium CG11_big_fil_rev_8_21_14_0_20_56_8]